MKTIKLEDSNFSMWCDQCYDWVDNYKPHGIEILCGKCDNRLLVKLPTKRQKQIRIDLAKAIWHNRGNKYE